MSKDNIILEEVAGLYRIIPLKVLRRTPQVSFDVVPPNAFPRADAMDRVLHEGGAISPGPVGDVARPWYMHPYQDDNLIVLHGTRDVDIYTPAHGKVESFVVTPHPVEKNGRVVYDGPAILLTHDLTPEMEHRLSADVMVLRKPVRVGDLRRLAVAMTRAGRRRGAAA